MSLEGAQASFISADRLVISLKGGELYVLTLYSDSMRSVRSFHFEKAAASVLTTCVSTYFKRCDFWWHKKIKYFFKINAYVLETPQP